MTGAGTAALVLAIHSMEVLMPQNPYIASLSDAQLLDRRRLLCLELSQVEDEIDRREVAIPGFGVQARAQAAAAVAAARRTSLEPSDPGPVDAYPFG